MKWEGMPPAIAATDIPVRSRLSAYPEPFASMMEGREKRQLGDFFGLSNFGVNLTRLKPGARSALRHSHTKQDEFIYVLTGNPTLYTDEGATKLAPGVCTGFPAGTGNGHHLINESDADVVYLEIGERTPDDRAEYPDDDIAAGMRDGRWIFTHKDGTPYDPD